MSPTELESRTDHMIYDPFERELFQYYENEDDNVKWNREMHHYCKDDEDGAEGPRDMILQYMGTQEYEAVDAFLWDRPKPRAKTPEFPKHEKIATVSHNPMQIKADFTV